MANPADDFYQSILDAIRVEGERMALYKQQYGAADAERLANAYVQFPWVNPEILVSIVLAGQDDLLPQVADYAASRAAQAGWTPFEQSREDQRFNDIIGGVLDAIPEGDDDALLMAKTLTNFEETYSRG